MLTRLCAAGILLSLAQPAFAEQIGEVARGWIFPEAQATPCVTAEQLTAMLAEASRFEAPRKKALSKPTPSAAVRLPFYPQAGTLWQDLFPMNFVDLDPGPGIMDYNGTGYTYDGHDGTDSGLVSFSEQMIGVPVFAALDGTVVAVHDGEPDRNTVAVPGTLSNYVILRHANLQDTVYLHLKKDSVAVTLGQVIKAGTQIGLTASSGMSSGPHLHFVVRYNGVHYEPFAGPQNPGASGWVSQIPFRAGTYMRDFAITTQDLVGWDGKQETTRTGTLVGAGVRNFKFWTVLHNLPASSTYRLRVLRPNGTLRYDSGTVLFGGDPTVYRRGSFWWWNYNIDFDAFGDWTLELSVNNTVMIQAPLRIAASAVNRPPAAVTPAFDAVDGDPEQVIFCRVPFRLLDDPDYDVVRYRFEWKRNGTTIRDSTNASLADAIPAGSCALGDVLTCTVTPSDGVTSAASATVTVQFSQTYAAWAAARSIADAPPLADHDGDGLSNLLEYALNLPPAARSALPPVTRNETGQWTWSLPTNPAAAAHVSIVVETSTDLVNWEPATFDALQNLWIGGSSADPVRFMRVRVNY